MNHAISHHAGEVRSGGIPLFRIAGIRIRLDYSWFLIFLVFFVGLSLGYFPGVAPEASAAGHWTAGALATLLLFASIVIHELAHSWMAVRAGIPVPEIRLFLLGGVSRISQEPTSPQVELRVAIAGPLMSFALALVCAFLAEAGSGAPWMVPAILSYLAWINVALGVFNLLPAYPLDGGRVLRAIVWWKTGALRRATRVASNAGRTFALALMILGGVQILSGVLVGGLWMILIGMFLRTLAKQGYEHVVLRKALTDVDVERVMVPADKLISVPPALCVDELVHDYFLGHGYHAFPVVEDGRVIGLVSSADVRGTSRSEWPGKTVSDVMAPLDEDSRIAPDDSLFEALRRFSNDRRRLLVMKDGELRGLVSSDSICRFVELRSLVQDA